LSRAISHNLPVQKIHARFKLWALPSFPMEAQLNALIDAVRQAGADGRTLRLRGGGSKDFWGQSPTGEVLEGRDAAWDGRTLRAQVAVLPPGGEYTIVFTALAAAAGWRAQARWADPSESFSLHLLAPQAPGRLEPVEASR
jgi:hypothetical protein